MKMNNTQMLQLSIQFLSFAAIELKPEHQIIIF